MPRGCFGSTCGFATSLTCSLLCNLQSALQWHSSRQIERHIVITTPLKIISALSFPWTVISYTEERERESDAVWRFCNRPSEWKSNPLTLDHALKDEGESESLLKVIPRFG